MSSVATPVTTRKGLLKTTLKVSPVRTNTRNTKLRFTGVNNIKYLSETTNENISDPSKTQITKEEPVITYDTYKAVRNEYVVEKYNEYFAKLNDEEKRQMNEAKEIEIKAPYKIEFDNLPDSEKEKYRKSYAAGIIKKLTENPKKKETRNIYMDGKNNSPITQSFYIFGMPQSFFTNNTNNFKILNISQLFMGKYLELLSKDKIIQEQYKDTQLLGKYGELSNDILNQLVSNIYKKINKNEDISKLEPKYTELLKIEPTEYNKIGNQSVSDKQLLLNELIINNYIRISILACIDKQDLQDEYNDDNYYFYAYNPEAFYRTTNQVYEIFKYSNNNQDFSEEIYNTLLQNISQYVIEESDDIKKYHLQKIALVYTEFILRLKYMLSKNIDGNKIFAELFIESNSPIVKLLKYYNTMQGTVNITAIDSKYLDIQPVFIIYHLLIELSITDPLSLQKIYDTIIYYIPYCNIFYKSSYQEYIKFIIETNNIHYDFKPHKLFKPETVYKYTCKYLESIMPQLDAIADSKIIFLDTGAKLP